MSVGATTGPPEPDGSRPGRAAPAALPAAVGAASALVALSTLGLTWVRRSVEGPLGEASAAQVDALSGREVAPVVAALVPGVAAVVVVALLLRGWWRAGALLLGALAAAGAALAAAEVLLPGGAGDGGSVTATPAVAALACLLAAVGAVLGALATVRARGATGDGDGDGADASDGAGAADGAGAVGDGGRYDGGYDGALGDGPGQRAVPATGRTVAEPDPEPAELWRALDAGHDPT